MKKMTKKSHKKAQVKIQETAFVLLAIVLLFSLVLIFYFRIHSSRLAKEAAELQQQRALSLLDKVAAMPELRCSMSLGFTTVKEVLCIDEDKLESMTDPIGPFIEDYKNIWKGLLEVKITEIYPTSGKEFVLYSSEKRKEEEGNRTYSTFVPLFKMEYNEVGWYNCTVGMISISIDTEG